MIAVVGICRDEADIADRWVRHTLAEGVDRIYIADASSDGTREILRSFDAVTVFEDADPHVQQAAWTNRLAAVAADDGAEWLIPTDLDEFIYAPTGETVADALKECPHDKLYLTCWPHLDWQTKFTEPHRLPKVAFRYQPGAQVTTGNHEVSIPGGEYGVLAMRELQYRGFEHFVQKTHARSAVLSPADRALGVGSHCTQYDGWDDERMMVEWNRLTILPTVNDPIPTHVL